MKKETQNYAAMKKFGSNIKQLREERGLSQERLSQIAQTNRTYIGMIERAERNITLCNIIKLAHALEVTPSELLEGV